jgi:hypothetical protein
MQGGIVSTADGHIVARNMYRKEINILRNIVHKFGFIYKNMTLESIESGHYYVGKSRMPLSPVNVLNIRLEFIQGPAS